MRLLFAAPFDTMCHDIRHFLTFDCVNARLTQWLCKMDSPVEVPPGHDGVYLCVTTHATLRLGVWRCRAKHDRMRTM